MSRFERQMPIVGEEGQQRIMASRVGIVGCGGLGVDALTQLVVAGAMDFVLADPGMPEISGLNTQFIYAPGDMRPKSQIVAEWALALNYSVMAQSHADAVGTENVRILTGSSVVLDCTGDEDAAIAISEWCADSGVPLIRGRCSGLDGRIDVCAGGRKYPVEPSVDGAPKIGAVVSVVAGIMASEAVRLMAEPGSAGRSISVDARTWTVSSDEGAPQ